MSSPLQHSIIIQTLDCATSTCVLHLSAILFSLALARLPWPCSPGLADLCPLMGPHPYYMHSIIQRYQYWPALRSMIHGAVSFPDLQVVEQAMRQAGQDTVLPQWLVFVNHAPQPVTHHQWSYRPRSGGGTTTLRRLRLLIFVFATQVPCCCFVCSF